MPYKEEQLNYFRMVYIVMNIFSAALRDLFKSEWRSAYGTSWRDTTVEGRQFYWQESPSNKQNNRVELAVIAKGDSSKFDNSTLFYCLLYSNSLGDGIRRRKRHVHNEIDCLRKMRNQVCHIAPLGEVSRTDFDKFCRDAISAFTTLRLPTSDLKKVMKEKTFETKELQALQSQLLVMKQRLEEYEAYICNKQEKVKQFQRKFRVEKHYRNLQRSDILTRKDVDALKRQKNKELRAVQLVDTVVYKGSSTICSFLQYLGKHEPACKELFIEAMTTDTDVVASQTGQITVVFNSEHPYPENFLDFMQIMTTDIYQKGWVEMEQHADFYLCHSTSPALHILIKTELAYGLGIKGEKKRGEELLDVAMANMWQAAGSDGQWLMARALARRSLMYNYRKDYAGSRALAEQALSMINTMESPEEHRVEPLYKGHPELRIPL